MPYLFGFPITADDALTIIDLLHRNGRADDLGAAATIGAAIADDSATIQLSLVERDAVLTILLDPPESLARLQGLMRDQPDPPT